jgi:hypothetical protein
MRECFVLDAIVELQATPMLSSQELHVQVDAVEGRIN